MENSFSFAAPRSSVIWLSLSSLQPHTLRPVNSPEPAAIQILFRFASAVLSGAGTEVEYAG